MVTAMSIERLSRLAEQTPLSTIGQWGGWFWKRADVYEDPPVSLNAGQCLNIGGF